MTVPIPIIPQGSRRGGLESVSVPIPLPVTDWRNGVEITPACGTLPYVWGCTSPQRLAPDDVKPISPIPAGVQFWPTLVGVETQCVRRDMGSPIGDVQTEVAQVGLTRTEWSVAAGVLYDGNIGNLSVLIEQNGANPSFYSEATVVAGQNYVTPAPLLASVRKLIAEACDCYGDQFTLHVPAQYLPHFMFNELVEWYEDMGHYMMGNIPVSFDCYENLGPLSTPAPADRIPAADGSEVWIYASATPLVSFGDTEFVEAFYPLRNERTIELVRPLIVAFDNCCVFAALATA